MKNAIATDTPISPENKYHCHSSVDVDSSASPPAPTNAPVNTTTRGPRRSASRPTNGDASPDISSVIDTPSDTSVRVHPNSVSIGSKYNANDHVYSPPNNAVAPNAPATTHQP